MPERARIGVYYKTRASISFPHASLSLTRRCRIDTGVSSLPDFDFRVLMAMRMPSSVVSWGVLAVMVLGLSSQLVQEAQAQCAGGDLTKLYSCMSASKANVMPTAACCQALAGFNSAAGEACLCAASTDPRFTSSGARAEYAILIPQKCNIKYKAGYVCNGVVIPGGQ